MEARGRAGASGNAAETRVLRGCGVGPRDRGRELEHHHADLRLSGQVRDPREHVVADGEHLGGRRATGVVSGLWMAGVLAGPRGRRRGLRLDRTRQGRAVAHAQMPTVRRGRGRSAASCPAQAGAAARPRRDTSARSPGPWPTARQAASSGRRCPRSGASASACRTGGRHLRPHGCSAAGQQRGPPPRPRDGARRPTASVSRCRTGSPRSARGRRCLGRGEGAKRHEGR